MKKKLISIGMAICLMISPLTVTAREEDENTQWLYVETPVSATDFESLAQALPGGESEPDDQNIVWIPVATLDANLVLEQDQNISTLGKLIIPSGVTLTIYGYLEAETIIEAGAKVVVGEGGYFGTTMGGNTTNHGEIVVQEGGVLRSIMGASIVNEADGKVVLDGTFMCGCVHYDNADHIWFENKNTSPEGFSGHGEIIVDAVGTEPVDLDAMIEKAMELLGQEKRFDNWDDISIFKEIAVNDLEELTAAFEAHREIKGEMVEGNMDTIVDLNGDVTIPEGKTLESMIQVRLSPGVHLNIEGCLVAGVIIGEGGTVWDEEAEQEVILPAATVVVERGGILATTQGGDIENYGNLIVKPDGRMESQMGGNIRNYGNMELGGWCYVGGFDDRLQDVSGIWFLNEGTIKAYKDENDDIRTGHIVLKNIPSIQEDKVGEMDPVAAAGLLKERINGNCEIPAYITADDFDTLKLLATASEVEGIYLCQEECEEPSPMLFIPESLDLSGKKLCISGYDVIVEETATLKLGSIDDLSFADRWARIVVEEPSITETAGGTLAIGDTNVISGHADKNAIFTVTGDIMSLGSAQWNMFFGFPAAAKTGGWYYVHSESGSADAAGELSDAICLPLLVDGTLNITGDFKHPGSVEIRNGFVVKDGAKVSIGDIDYGTDSVECNAVIKGENSTTYELEFDLNCGNGYEDRFDHLAYSEDSRIYLRGDGNEVPVQPEREGYTFEGWKAESGWTEAATPEKLQQFVVKEEVEKGGTVRWYVPVPEDFPVVMVAQWKSDQPEERPFEDVDTKEWYYDAVYHCYDNGYFKGTSDTGFSPMQTMTREMFATVLYRIAGEPTVTGENPFTDVENGAWYTDPVIWANGQGIIQGYGKGKFGTNDPVTREQIVTIFWRYNNEPKAVNGNLSGFNDADEVSDWAKDAFEWAVSVGVINGKAGGLLDPKGKATRAEVAKIVTNFDTNVK